MNLPKNEKTRRVAQDGFNGVKIRAAFEKEKTIRGDGVVQRYGDLVSGGGDLEAT